MATYNGNTAIDVGRLATGDIINYEYSGSAKNIALPKGIYKLEVWGAEGGGSRSSGDTNSGLGGTGGYSKGTVMFTDTTLVYIAVGELGLSSTSGIAVGGWNGGGDAIASSSSEPANGGGGATDIRISTNSLYARIIVAGGGGGGGEDSGDYVGYAGGLTSISSRGTTYQATQTGTGLGGAFGLGANTTYDGGAGGGGWFGGGTPGGTQSPVTSNSSSDTSGGDGGSGYVLTSSSIKPSGYLLGAEYYLTETSLLAGNTSFTSPTGSSETGHTGNGYARITIIEIEKGGKLSIKIDGAWSNGVPWIKTNGIWKKSTKVDYKQNNIWEGNA